MVLAPCSRASTTRRCRQTIDQRQRKSEAAPLLAASVSERVRGTLIHILRREGRSFKVFLPPSSCT